MGKAIKEELLKIRFANPRDWGKGGRVDDYPFGGGATMIMGYHPLKGALDSFSSPGRVLYLSPQGKLWNFKKARASVCETLTLICGRYGGVDERFITECVDEEISIGNYILNGGEAAALALIESVFRFLPGALGNPDSLSEESFEKQGLLQGPQWTRPRHIAEASAVPELLFSGNHKQLKEIRFCVALLKTFLKRPELLSSRLRDQLPEAVGFLRSLSLQELGTLGFSKEDLKRAEKPVGSEK